MPLRNHTGIIPWRLKGAQGQTQSWTAGGQLSWLLSSIPPVTDGKLCNYLYGLCVTVIGRIIVAGIGEGTPPPGSDSARTNHRTMWDIIRSLFESVQVHSCWHGTPLSSQHVKGSFLQLLEFVGNGNERAYRQGAPIDVPLEPQPTARYFRTNIFIPLSLLCGEKGHHTALPAALYDTGEFVINCSDAATGPWGTDTISAVTVDVSALLVPEDEVRLGPAVQWIDYQQKVSGEAVDINSMGRVTTVDNVEPGAGIAGAFWLSNRNGLPGPGQVRDITDITVPWRGIVHTRHTDPIVLQMEQIVGCKTDVGGYFVGDDGDGSGEASGDVGGFPYDDYDYGVSELGRTNALAALPRNPLVLPVVTPSKDLEATKVAVIEGTQQLQLQHRTGTPAVDTGTHHILCCQLHSWTPQAFASAMQRLITSGVCRAVLKTDNVEWSTKVLKKQDPTGIAPRKRRFFAQRLVPVADAAVKVP